MQTSAPSMLRLFVFCCCLSIGYSHAAELKPLSVQISEADQHTGLTLLKATFPATVFQLAGQQNALLAQWRFYCADGALQQLYAAADDTQKQVFLYALVRERRSAEIQFYFAGDRVSFPQQPAHRAILTIDNAQPAQESFLKPWTAARKSMFEHITRIYNTEDDSDRRRGSRRFRNRSGNADELNVFSLFSGEAAIQETLQTQLIAGAADKPVPSGQTLASLQGPEVPSHPFTELLQHSPQGSLAIADLVPAERWFVHIGKPGKALQWADRLAAAGAELSGMQQQNYIDQALLDRYLRRLHLSRDFVTQLGPLAAQAALFGPDLYLQYGSNLTLLVEAPQSAVLNTLLKIMLGVAGTGREVTAYGNSAQPAYFASHGRWLIFSTSRAEAEAALFLAQNDGYSSLGRSDEFRYMLGQLPPAPDGQGFYLYLSDPFIRAMVGPKIKISQARRHHARARLHLTTDAALLHRLDHGRAASLEDLLKLGYVQPHWLKSWEGDEIRLDEQGWPYSFMYGTLAAMTPLDDIAVQTLSEQEREAYQRYVEEYSRFWRTTFDPIGIRVEVADTVRVETLILPLIQNSIYDMVRGAIGGEPVAITLPALSPEPVTTLSLKLSDVVREEIRRDRWLRKIGLLEQLGDSVHIALYDNDPILGLGSADVLGSFSGPWLSAGMRGDFLYWGLMGALFTQPVALFVELKHSGPVDLMSVYKLAEGFSMGFGSDSTLERLGERGWVFTWSLENIIRLHLYIRQVDNYLVISNRQFDYRAQENGPGSSVKANAGLKVDFTQLRAMLPTLHLHQMQRRGQAELKTAGRLLPFLLLGAADVEQAGARHQAIFGERPASVPGSRWVWRPEVLELQHSLFGSPRQSRVPAYFELSAEQRKAGLFTGLAGLDLSFRFVDEGVRVILQLKPNK